MIFIISSRRESWCSFCCSKWGRLFLKLKYKLKEKNQLCYFNTKRALWATYWSYCAFTTSQPTIILLREKQRAGVHQSMERGPWTAHLGLPKPSLVCSAWHLTTKPLSDQRWASSLKNTASLTKWHLKKKYLNLLPRMDEGIVPSHSRWCWGASRSSSGSEDLVLGPAG